MTAGSPWYHIRFGLHSRIPICCIVAFLLRLPRRTVPGYGARYAPCPGCRVLLRLGAEPARVHWCVPDRTECREWTEGKEYALLEDGQWVLVATVRSVYYGH